MDALERWESRRLQAVVAHQTAHHGPVFLLDVTGVVLQIRPRAREGDAMIGAVVQQHAIDELGPVVAVEAKDAKWQLRLASLQRIQDGLLAFVAQTSAGDPPRRHVDHAERVQKRTSRSAQPDPSRGSRAAHRSNQGRYEMGIWRFSNVPALVVLMPRRALVCSRNGLSARSIAAALMRATRVWTATGNSRSAWRRRRSTSSAP